MLAKLHSQIQDDPPLLRPQQQKTGVSSETFVPHSGAPMHDSDNMQEEEGHYLKLGIHASILWKHKKVTDVILKLGDDEYYAHKTVLSCYSTALKDILFSNEHKHLLLHRHIDVISLDSFDITKEALEILLYHIYTGHLEVTCQNIGEVFTAARKLGVESAVNQCVTVFEGQENPVTQPVYIYVTAKKLREDITAKRALDVMCKNFEKVVGTSEFLHLTNDQVCEFLSSNELAVRSEIIVYLAALKWLSVDFLDRECYITDVLACVRFPLMTLNEILASHSPPLLPGVTKIPEVNMMLLKATCYVAARTVNEEDLFQEYNCEPRIYLIKKKPLILWDPHISDPVRFAQYQKEVAATAIQSQYRGFRTRKVFSEHQEPITPRFKPDLQKTQGWLSFLKNPLKRRSSSAPTTYSVIADPLRNPTTNPYDNFQQPQQNQIRPEYQSLDGGDNLRTVINRHAQRYDTRPTPNYGPQRSSSWNQQRQSIRGVGGGGVGGHIDYNQRGNRRSVVWRNPQQYDASNSSREEARNQFMDTGAVLVLGGSDMTAEGKLVLQYAPRLNIWSEFAELPCSRHHMCAVYLNDKIYCMGGCDSRNSKNGRMVPEALCFSFDVPTKKWTQLPSMKHPRMYHGAGVIGGSIFVACGKDDNDKLLDTIEYYTPGEGCWKMASVRLSSAKMGSGVCAHNGRLWIVGGLVLDRHTRMCNAIRDVELYDPLLNDILYDAAKLPEPLGFPALVECHGEIFSIGGVSNMSTDQSKEFNVNHVYAYSHSMMAWKKCAPLPTPKHMISAVAFGSRIYAISGISDNAELASPRDCVAYDILHNTWTHCHDLPTSAVGVCAVAVPRLLVI